MKKLLIVVITVLITAALSYPQPRLVATAPTFDFGYTPQNVKLVHHFWFKSVGTDTLLINKIKTGCACAVMPLERDWLAPGDSMKVGIYWDIKRNLGKIERKARIFTNAGPDPVWLHLKGTVVHYPDSTRPISPKPFRFLLARSSHKDIDSLSFTLTNHSNQNLAVGFASFPPEEVELVLPDSVQALASSTGYVKLRSEFADTEFQTSVTLLMSDQGHTHITIPIGRKFYTVKDESK
jgi:hypothetical protein